MNCKRCGARLPRGMAICPECGARQRLQAGRVRCAQCGKAVLADLTVCPHCGRTLRPAGPRWGLWLTGAIAIVLVGMVTLNALPLRAAWQQIVSLQERLASLVQIPELPAAPTPTPTLRAGPTATGSAPALRTPAAATPKAATALSVTLTVIRPPATTSPTPGAGAPTTASTAAAAAASATSPEATQAYTQTPTATPTPVSASPAPVTPTATPTPPAATPTEDATRYYTVKAGDTFIDIGNATGIAWEDIAAYNGMTVRSLLLPGMKLKLPPAGGTGQTAGPTPTPAARRTYRVQAGDSLYLIASKFGISWQSLAQANGLTASSMLQVGQELIIPSN